MGMQVGTGGAEMSEPNVVPFIDVLLVLLIIFMVITPLTPQGLETLVPQPPKGDQADTSSQRTVVIIINKDRTMMLNTEPTTLDTMGARLEEIFKTRAERVVFVKGDPDIEYQHVAKAIDVAKGAGIDRVGLMTPAVESGQ